MSIKEILIRKKELNLYPRFIMGLTGFDSGQKRYVSMPGIGMLAR